MNTILEVEKLALNLPERERTALAANLLNSLPGVLSDDDEGVVEALRRDAEIEAEPAQAISLADWIPTFRTGAQMFKEDGAWQPH